MHRILMICGLIVLGAAGLGQAQTATHAGKTAAGTTRHHHGAAQWQAAHKAGHGHKRSRTGIRRHHAAANHPHAKAHRASRSAQAT